jgi:hypothetical protein
MYRINMIHTKCARVVPASTMRWWTVDSTPGGRGTVRNAFLFFGGTTKSYLVALRIAAL